MKNGADASVLSTRVKLNAKNWFLTVPQTDMGKEEALRRLIDKFNGDPNKGSLLAKFIRVAHEKHKDEGNHLHVYLSLDRPLQTRRMDYFDDIFGKHCNIKKVWSTEGAFNYVSKDGDFVDHGQIPQECQPSNNRRRKRDPTTDDPSSDENPPKKGKWLMYAEFLTSGATIEDLRKKDPGFVMQHMKKIVEYVNYLRSIDQNEGPKLKLGSIEYTGTDSNTKLVVEWIRANFLSGKREHKQKQLYLFSLVGNMRKTVFFQRLERFYRFYWMDPTKHWADEYTDDYDAIILDEFNGPPWSVQFMNLLTQGSKTVMPIKGGHYTRMVNSPVVIIANKPVDVLYFPQNTSTLELRLEIVQLRYPLDIDNVKFFEEKLSSEGTRMLTEVSYSKPVDEENQEDDPTSIAADQDLRDSEDHSLMLNRGDSINTPAQLDDPQLNAAPGSYSCLLLNRSIDTPYEVKAPVLSNKGKEPDESASLLDSTQSLDESADDIYIYDDQEETWDLRKKRNPFIDDECQVDD